MSMPDSGMASVQPTTWLTVEDVGTLVRCGPKVIYRAVRTRRLRAARLNLRGDYRFKPEWVDAWLETIATVENS